MKNKVLVFGLVGESVFMQTNHFHSCGETITIDNIHKEPGGKGFNQAITLARLGIKTTFIGVIGNDYKKVCEDFLNSEQLSYHLVIKNGMSAYATIITDKKGENEVSVYHGVNKLFSRHDVKKYENEFLDTAYVLIQAELPEEVVDEVIKLSKKYGVKVIINPAPAKPFIKKYLNDAFLITPNLQEAKTLFSLDEITIDNLKEQLSKFSLSRVVITLGSKGVIIKNVNKVTYLSALKIKKVVDTTGAGDVFNGALIASLMKDNDLIEACKFAVKVSGMSVQTPYVMPSIPTLKKVEDYTDE